MNVITPVSKLIEDIKIIDVDTHLSEPHDLWTKRAPAGLKHLVPRVVSRDGKPVWIIGEDLLLTGLGSCPISVVRADGHKVRTLEWFNWGIEDAHPGAYDTAERIKVMDQSNIFAQIVYPNTLGFGGQAGWNAPENLRIAAIEIFNDAMAEMSQDSNGRLFPMALLPWWDVKLAAAEARRAHGMGLRGVIIHSDPQEKGLPDLASPHWDPLWESCAGLNLPVNFHIGASESTMAWIGNSGWPSQGRDFSFVVTSSMMFFGNARVMANIILSGILERHPTIKFVSVESGIGWIPMLLETLEYQIAENASTSTRKLSLTPKELFERNIYACFWFERRNIADSIRQVGADNVMFETDFPHPTCLYPDPLQQAASGLAQLDHATRRKILSENAAKLYNISIG